MKKLMIRGATGNSGMYSAVVEAKRFQVRCLTFVRGCWSTNGTPPKINMEHNNGGLEDDFPFQIGDF